MNYKPSNRNNQFYKEKQRQRRCVNGGVVYSMLRPFRVATFYIFIKKIKDIFAY